MSQRQTEITDSNWWSFAACRGLDPNLFIPERGASHYEIADAKAVCKRCPVKDRCLEYAIVEDERTGVWGGTSGRDRRRMRSAKATRTA